MRDHRYRIHGLDVRTNIEVPSWPCAKGVDAGADSALGPWHIHIKTNDSDVAAEVAPGSGTPEWRWRDGPDWTELDIWGTPPGWDGNVASSAHFRVDHVGRTIDVRHSHDDAHGCIDLLARWVLPDIARNEHDLLPVHACAVETAAGAVLLLGDSGRGKSTLTAALLAAGADFLGDEPISVDAHRAWPGTLVLRVDPMSAEQLLGRVGTVDGAGKALLQFSVDASSSRPLAALVVLTHRRQAGPLVQYRRMHATEALVALMGLRYSRSQLRDRVRGDLRRVADLVNSVPVLEVSLLDDRNRVNEAAVELLDAVAALGASSPSEG